MSVAEPTSWTYEDYARIPEDGKRHEIIRGVHFVTPAPKVRHQVLLTRLLVALHGAVDEGEVVLAAPCDVILSKHDIVQPDLIFVSSARRDRLTEANIQGAPDLLVEILSTSTRKTDETRKLELYERAGVLEYWIVDPDASRVTIYGRQNEAELFSPVAFELGSELTTDRLPALCLSVTVLFAA